MTIQQTIEAKLTADFSPAHLEVINESHQHNVPPGSESHFKVVLVSTVFDGKPLIARHRSVNATLAQELEGGVHALSLTTKTPTEWETSGGAVPKSPPCLGGGNAGGGN